MGMERYAHLSDQSLFDKFILNSADIKVADKEIQILLKKKKALPLLYLETMNNYKQNKYPWLNNFPIQFLGATYS